MKKKLFSLIMIAALGCVSFAGCGETAKNQDNSAVNTVKEEVGDASASGKEFKVGIVQYVDDASLNQIVDNIEAELDVLGEEYGVTFNYVDYYYNGQADSTTINQIVTELINDEVDVLVPIATPTALICQAATEDNKIPVIFSAVSDPEGAGLVASNDAPGSNVTGTSDALNTEALLELMFKQNPDIKSVGLLYDKSQDSSAAPIAAAKKFCEVKGVSFVEKTGTSNDEVMFAADALVAAGVDAIFTPTDNTIMTAELGIYEKFIDAKIPQYCGADSFALNGAFLGYGVNYADLGVETARMIAEVLVKNASPATLAVRTLDNGIATVNTETAEAIGLDWSVIQDENFKTTTTAEEFN